MLASNGPANISGKRVMTSMRSGTALLPHVWGVRAGCARTRLVAQACCLAEQALDLLALAVALLAQPVRLAEDARRLLERRPGRAHVRHLQRVVDGRGRSVARFDAIDVAVVHGQGAAGRLELREGPLGLDG